MNPQRFIDYYSSIGWKVGKTKKQMKDWKAAVRTWEDNEKGDKNNVDQNQRNEYYSTTDIYGYN